VTGATLRSVPPQAADLILAPARASAAVAVAMKELGTEADTAKLIRRGLKELAQ
jgi:Holliday junction DNA helicase RuvA